MLCGFLTTPGTEDAADNVGPTFGWVCTNTKQMSQLFLAFNMFHHFSTISIHVLTESWSVFAWILLSTILSTTSLGECLWPTRIRKHMFFWLRTEEFMFWTHTFTKSSEISGFFPGGGYKHVWFIGSFMFYWFVDVFFFPSLSLLFREDKDIHPGWLARQLELASEALSECVFWQGWTIAHQKSSNDHECSFFFAKKKAKPLVPPDKIWISINSRRIESNPQPWCWRCVRCHLPRVHGEAPLPLWERAGR